MKLSIGVLVIFLLLLIPNEVTAEEIKLPICDPEIEIQAPCRMELGAKAPWTGTLILEDDLIELEASLRALEESVEVLKKGLENSESSCRASIDAMSDSYEERINKCFELFEKPVAPVIVQETDWWEFALWAGGGVAVGALLMGAFWAGTAL